MDASSPSTDPRPVASVIVGSVNGGEWIFTLLDALARQIDAPSFETVIADRCSDGTLERIQREFPEARVLRAPGATLPELRARAFEASRGKYVFVTEDHTVPPPHWIQRFVDALEAAPAHIAAVGGPVDNAMNDRTLDWAAFLCEYSSYLPPQPSGEVSDIPGMNIAYRREALESVEPEALTRGFWEATVHPKLLARGSRFLRLADVVIEHKKSFGFYYFLSQRFHYSRYYAGTRFSEDETKRRALYTALSMALPPLVLGRVVRGALTRRRYRGHALKSLPALGVFSLAYAAGEAIGYAFGPSESLREIE